MGNSTVIPKDLAKYDYRANLIVDQNNPILIQKAWRDRFSGDSHWKDGKEGGKAYLGVSHGEDAMTWNVFRSLQKEGQSGYQIIADVFKLNSRVEKILFWGCDVEKQGDEQQLLNILIRTVDGRLQGTMTEPDLVFVCTDEIAFVECKLNSTGNRSPWRAQPGIEGQKSGSEKRMEKYFEQDYNELRDIDNWPEIYQLLRQYVYASLLAKHLKKRPAVIPLVNQGQNNYEVISRVYERVLLGPLNKSGIFHEMVTWQAFIDPISRSGLINGTTLKDKMLEAIAASREYQ